MWAEGKAPAGNEMRKLFFFLAVCCASAILWDPPFPVGLTAARAQSTEAPGSAVEAQKFLVRGVVQELPAGGGTVVIRHEAVPDFMPAMTMPFKVTDETELRNLAPGDEVTFRLHVSEQDNWIDEIRKTGKIVPLNRSASDTAPIIKPLKVGERVPDYVLTDESGRSIRLDQFKGNALALTFVFTRCPVPDFCRRMSSNFAEAGEQLAARKSPRNWHLLSISFDPEFDTPAELKRYGERYPHDPERWTFATAQMSVIDPLAGRFGLVVRRNGSELDHNLRTAVIDTEGRLRKIFVGNEWTPDDLVREMVKATRK